MGHYYADMMCDTCGLVRCICEHEPENKWVIYNNQVLHISEFDKQHKYVYMSIGGKKYPIDSMPLLKRCYLIHFDSREAAEKWLVENKDPRKPKNEIYSKTIS